jgi:L-fuculose-phosphate aldolase
MGNRFEFEVRGDICKVGKLLFEKSFVDSNDDNISIRLSKNEILTTPVGVSKSLLRPDMRVKVNLEGEVLEGVPIPSSELKMHLRIYRDYPEVGAVVHAHPPYATAFAVAGIPLDQPMMSETIMMLGPVLIAGFEPPYTEQIPHVAGYLKNHHGVLLEKHGVLTWGKDVFDAYFHMELLEFAAQTSVS